MCKKILYTPLSEADSRDFFRLAGDPRVAATMRFDCPGTLEESDRVLQDYLSPCNRSYALRFSPDQPLWGVFAFKGEPDGRTAGLSQMLVPEQWGQGLGNQIIRDMVDLDRQQGWYDALECWILETNTASRRMVEKSGFRVKQRHRFPGMTEDLVVYRLEL